MIFSDFPTFLTPSQGKWMYEKQIFHKTTHVIDSVIFVLYYSLFLKVFQLTEML